MVSNILKTLQQSPVRSSPKAGQLLSGKVQKLLPQDRAVVQLGGKQVHAQLEVPLTTGQSYLFQVKSTEKLLHLKVVSPQSLAQSQSGSRLLQMLGLKLTKTNIDFLNQLVKHNIPFHKGDLRKAIELLHQSTNKSIGKDVLLQMFQKQLPIKSSVFDALYTRGTTQMSKLLGEIQQEIKSASSNDILHHRLTSIVQSLRGTPSPLSASESSIMKLLTEVSSGRTDSFQLFKEAGIANKDISFSQFQREWEQWARGTSQRDLPPLREQEILNVVQNKSVKTAPFPVPFEQMIKQLKQLFDKQLPLSVKEQQTLKQWGAQLERGMSKNNVTQGPTTTQMDFPKHLMTKLFANHQTLQQSKTFQKLLPFLEQEHQSVLKNLVKHLPQVLGKGDYSQILSSPGLKEVIKEFNSLLSKQLTPPLRHTLIEWMSRTAIESSDPVNKDMMLLRMKTMLDLSGTSDEFMVKSQVQQDQPIQKELSLKSALLQVLQDGRSEVRPETAKQMIHLLNGLQMNAHHETAQSLQMTLQFPGDWLESTHDIRLNVEGRKTKDGEVDPAFCHIVFFLELKNMKETVIDLNIVNRRVGVTVFNYYESLEPVIQEYKASLAEGLQRLGYELSSLHVRRLKGTETPSEHVAHYSNHLDQGVDIRI